MRPYRGRLLTGLGATALGAGVGALIPIPVKRAIDTLRAGGSWEAVTMLAALLVLIATLQAALQYVQRRLVYDVSRDVEADLRNVLWARLVRQPPAYFDAFPTGDVLSRFTNDLRAIQFALGPGVRHAVGTVVTLVAAVGFMLGLDPVLTAWALAPLPLVSVVVQRFGRRIHHRSRTAQETLADISTAVQENLAGVRVVRAYGAEPAERGSFAAVSRSYVDANLALARIQAGLSPLLGLLLGASLLVILWVGGSRVATDAITLGDFVAFTMYVGMIAWPLIAFGWLVNLWQRAAASMDRLETILTTEPAIDDRRADRDARPSTGAVAFRDVTFRYAENRPLVLDGFSLEIPAGATIAITGPTGSGKTTIGRLVARLYEPESGVVELDGRPVDRYPLAVLRGAIALAPQEPFLFGDTLRANLEMGRGPVDPAVRADGLAIEAAAEIAGLAPDVAGFPDGYETVIGERGITLSGGQKQRAALTRALLADPLVLVLDDAFSAVDTGTEETILARLRAFMAERTTLLIGHRLSTLRNADRIVVLDDGRIVEDGNHDELAEAGGPYARLWRLQRLESAVAEH